MSASHVTHVMVIRLRKEGTALATLLLPAGSLLYFDLLSVLSYSWSI